MSNSIFNYISTLNSDAQAQINAINTSLPSFPLSKANGGLGEDVSTGLTNDQVAIVSGNALTIGALTANAIPNLDASKITTGTFSLARLPSEFSYVSARTVYLDPLSGNDANDGLTPQTPVKKLSRAFAIVNGFSPTAQTMVRLLIGAGQVLPEAVQNIPENCQIIGSGMNTTILGQGLNFNPTTTNAINIDVRDLYISNLTIDISAATSTTITIRDCQIPQSTLNSPNNGADQITVWGSLLEATCSIQGSIAIFDSFTGLLTVKDGTIATWGGGQIFGGIDITGNSTLTLLGVDTFASTGGAFTITGHIAGGHTPTVAADAASIHGVATITAPVNIVYLDDSKQVGYTATTPGNWTTPPTEVSQALDELATAVVGKQPLLTLPLTEANGGFGANISAIGTGLVKRTAANTYITESDMITISTTGLATGGGNAQLGSGITINVPSGTTAGTAAVGNDSRFNPAPTAAGGIIYDTGSAYAELSPSSNHTLLHGGATPS